MTHRIAGRLVTALLLAGVLLVGPVGPVLARTSADPPVAGAGSPTSTAGLQDVIRTIRKYLQMLLTLVTVGEGYDSTGAPPHVGPGPLPSPQIEPEFTI
jgi:hypothetical protein